MSDKIPYRTINTTTYPHAGLLEVDNVNHRLRLLIDERAVADDAMIRERFADTSISFEDALADPEVSADAQAVYTALRNLSLILLNRWRVAQETPNEPN